MILLRDLFSFEMVFTVFYFIAAYKGSPWLDAIASRADLTLLATAAGLLCGIPVWMKHRARLSRAHTRYLLAFGVFTLYALLSYLVAGSGENATLKMLRWLGFSSWALLAPLLLMRSAQRIDRLLRLTIVFSSLFVVEALVQLLRGDATIMGTLGNESYQAVGRYGGSALVMILALILNRTTFVRQSVLLPMAGLLLVAVALSMTRQAIVGCAVTVVALLYLNRRNSDRMRQAGRLALVLGALALLSLGLRMVILEDYDFTRFASRMHILSGDTDLLITDSRTEIYAVSWNLWLRYPLMGVGLGSFPDASGLPYRQSHNLVLELLCELGAIGFVFYGFLVALPAAVVLRQARSRMDATALALAAAWVFFLVCSMFSGDIADNRHTLVFGSLILAKEGCRAAPPAGKPGGPKQ